MIPRSLSASSLSTAELCLARWQQENLEYTPDLQNDPAMVGTSVHGGLEKYVEVVYIQKMMAPDLDLLIAYYRKAFGETFGWYDESSDQFKDGLELSKKWFKRTDLSDVEVLSVEQKRSFPIPVKVLGETIEIPFNYLMDRMDRMPDGSIRVVDYKSIRKPMKPEELKRKIQSRAYGLAAQIMYPDAPRIWVQFDLLRHEPIAIAFTKEDNIATWQRLCFQAQRIANTSDVNPPETLNAECKFCVRSAACETLRRHVAGEGILGISVEDAVKRKFEIEAQLMALKNLNDDLESVIQRHMVEIDDVQFETPFAEVSAKVGGRRAVDRDKVAAIVGNEVIGRYGGITIKALNEMQLDETLTVEQKAALKNVFVRTSTEAKMVITPKVEAGDIL